MNHSPDENLRFTIGVALGLVAALVSLKLRFRPSWRRCHIFIG
ncbi:MAG: hypothetical protein R3C26_08380 [Calditrichia bacterium]